MELLVHTACDFEPASALSGRDNSLFPAVSSVEAQVERLQGRSHSMPLDAASIGLLSSQGPLCQLLYSSET